MKFRRLRNFPPTPFELRFFTQLHRVGPIRARTCVANVQQLHSTSVLSRGPGMTEGRACSRIHTAPSLAKGLARRWITDKALT